MMALHDMAAAFFRLPLAGAFLSLAGFELASTVSRRLGAPLWANPVLLAIALVVGVLSLTGTRYETYFETAKLIHLLLGPAIVALAIPLYNNIRVIQRCAVAVLLATFLGGASAAVSAVVIAWSLHASGPVILSLAPKSVTTAIAIGISQQTGGIPELTAVLVVTTGILGAILTVPVLRLVGLDCLRASGLAAGVAGHAIGAAQLLAIDETAGAFAGLGMGLCGIGTATLLPLAVTLLKA